MEALVGRIAWFVVDGGLMVLRLRVEVANRRARKALAVYVDVGRDCAHPLVLQAYRARMWWKPGAFLLVDFATMKDREAYCMLIATLQVNTSTKI